MNTQQIAEFQARLEQKMKEPQTKLMTGLLIIGRLFPNQLITAIQFEDGSHKKFNYQLNGGKWQFIDLSHWVCLE